MMTSHRLASASLAILLLVPACSSNDSADSAGGSGQEAGAPGPDGGGTEDGATTKQYFGAPGVQITQVAIYQGVKRVLMVDGDAVDSDVPLIAGRDALVRVFYATDGAYDGQEVLGRLTLGEGEPIETTGTLEAISTDPSLTSTVYFKVPGERIGDTLEYAVELLQEGEGPTANAGARYPAQDRASLPVEGPLNTLRIILAPFQYDFDGSGRVPNLSPERVDSFRERFMAMYPISTVELSVRDPYPWNQEIARDGSGWQSLGFKLLGFRSDDGTSADVYYYGIFNPADTLGAYCGLSCLLGVTLLNDSPADVGNPMLRLALGVGFDSVATDTCVHEVGHAHGLQHAKCGAGLDPASIDPAFPYPGGGIGVWGWDIVNDTLRDPDDFTDIMGYCNTQWISDYHFGLLQFRGQHVNLPRWYTPSDEAATADAVEYDIISVDEGGKTAWRSKPVANPIALKGKNVAVTLFGEQGQAETVNGHYYRFDHMPGGWVFVPVTKSNPKRAEFVIDDRFSVATR